MSYLSRYKDGRLLLRLYVQPKSKKNAFVGIHGDAMKLAIASPPVDGKANRAVLTFLASFFDMKKRNFTIKHGLQSRTKSILIDDAELHTIQLQIESSLV